MNKIKVYFIIFSSIYLLLSPAQAQWVVKDPFNLFVNQNDYVMDSTYNGMFTGKWTENNALTDFNYLSTASIDASTITDLGIQGANNALQTALVDAVMGIGLAFALDPDSVGTTAVAIVGNLLMNQIANIGLLGGINLQQGIDLALNEVFGEFSAQLTNIYNQITNELATAGILPSADMQKFINDLVQGEIAKLSDGMKISLLNQIKDKVPPGTPKDWIEGYIKYDKPAPDTIAGNLMNIYLKDIAHIGGEHLVELTSVPKDASDPTSYKIFEANINITPFYNKVSNAFTTAKDYRIAVDNQIDASTLSAAAKADLKIKNYDRYLKIYNDLVALNNKVTDTNSDFYKKIKLAAINIGDSAGTGITYTADAASKESTFNSQLNSINENCSGEGNKANMQKSVVQAGLAGALFGMKAEGNNLKATIQCTNEYLKLLTLLTMDNTQQIRKIVSQKYNENNEGNVNKIKEYSIDSHQQLTASIDSILSSY